MTTGKGGSAFPANPNNAWCDPVMTLRDYFAAKAMLGLIACQEVDVAPSDLAAMAYQMADIMLKAREE